MSMQPMPQSLEAEQACLGAMMMERESIAHALRLLKPLSFYREMHRDIFGAVVDIFNAGREVDLIAVVEELRRRGKLQEIGGTAYLTALIEACPSAANIEAYAKSVSESYARRELINLSHALKTGAFSGEKSAAELADETWMRLMDLNASNQRGGFVALGEVVAEEFRKVVEHQEKPDTRRALPTGFHALDSVLRGGGVKPGQLIVLGARPGMGKSALAMQVARHAAVKLRENTLVFNMEMFADELVQRMMSTETGIRGEDIENGALTDEEWQKLDVCGQRLLRAPLYINQDRNLTIASMRSEALACAAKNGPLGLIIVDYLQLLAGNGRKENRVQEISEVSRGLKKLAGEMKVPIISPAQLSRAVEQRENKRPMNSDLRESGSIEQDADIVAFIYRDGYYHDAPDTSQQWGASPIEEAEIIIGKQRNGFTGTVRLGFQKDFARFVDFER